MHLYREGTLSKSCILRLCAEATALMAKEPNIVRVDDPVMFIGDIHGQFYDLHNILTETGRIGELNYVFLGDYVDRGSFSVECLCILYCLKINFPKQITLLRGNHESK